jgi:hypothetical protein
MWAGAITRTTFPTCRAHYPGGCVCRLLPRITQPSMRAFGAALPQADLRGFTPNRNGPSLIDRVDYRAC